MNANVKHVHLGNMHTTVECLRVHHAHLGSFKMKHMQSLANCVLWEHLQTYWVQNCAHRVLRVGSKKTTDHFCVCHAMQVNMVIIVRCAAKVNIVIQMMLQTPVFCAQRVNTRIKRGKHFVFLVYLVISTINMVEQLALNVQSIHLATQRN